MSLKEGKLNLKMKIKITTSKHQEIPYTCITIIHNTKAVSEILRRKKYITAVFMIMLNTLSEMSWSDLRRFRFGRTVWTHFPS